MSRICAVRSCANSTSGYSTLCEAHKRTQRRHGHPEQTSVTGDELKPYRSRLEARRIKNAGNPTWALLEARWEALAAHAGATLDSFAMGAAGSSYERQAAEQLAALRGAMPAVTLIDVALAMFALAEDRPTRFKSDRAFDAQLARRVRALAEVNSGSHWSAKEGRLKRTYRDVPPRVLESMAASLKLAFGVAGMRLAELDKTDAAVIVAERQQLHDALKEMN